jgi:hypothetical protein
MSAVAHVITTPTPASARARRHALDFGSNTANAGAPPDDAALGPTSSSLTPVVVVVDDDVTRTDSNADPDCLLARVTYPAIPAHVNPGHAKNTNAKSRGNVDSKHRPAFSAAASCTHPEYLHHRTRTAASVHTQ